jgi:outer membrane protein TolC
MSRQLQQALAWAMITLTVLTGCHPTKPFYINEDGDLSHYLDVATDIEFADVHECSLDEVCHTREPLTISNPAFDSIWDMTLEEATRTALHNSKVVRSFGQVSQFGQILAAAPQRISTAVDAVSTIYDTAIQETGQGGVEQALANFDAVFNFSTDYRTSDRPQNFQAVLAPILVQDQVTINAELQKRAATGTQLFLRNVNIYTDNPISVVRGSRAMASDWFVGLEAEARQPLLRGRGSQVNRIPIVLARIRTDQSLADFEGSVRNQVNDVERAYWDLYFFYRNLEATKIGRDSALVTWKKVHALYQGGAPGGEAEKEAQAREQYFFFRAQVEEALRDLYKSETRLRFLLGITATDGRLIRPIDEPTAAKVTFEWNEIHCESLIRSVELRRQKWSIKQRELELIAARNQLLPQLDAVMLYRWLGVGDRFDSANRVPQDFPAVGSTAIDALTDGNHQEGQLAIQLNVPIGFRRELAGVRNGELLLARERARLEDMELEISHRLTDAVQELEAQYMIMQSNLNRRTAAEKQVEAVEAAYEAGTVLLDLLLDSQRRRADAEISFYQSVIEYNLAITTVHLRKGSLLEYDGVLLAEGPWPAKAYFDAHDKARRRDASYYLNYGYSRPNVASRGPVPQIKGPGGCESGDCLGNQEIIGQPEIVEGHEPGDVIFDAIEALPPEANEPVEAPNDLLLTPADQADPAEPGVGDDGELRSTNYHVGNSMQRTSKNRSSKNRVRTPGLNPATGQPTMKRTVPQQAVQQPRRPAIDYLGALDSASTNVLRDHTPVSIDRRRTAPRQQLGPAKVARSVPAPRAKQRPTFVELEPTVPPRQMSYAAAARPLKAQPVGPSVHSEVPAPKPAAPGFSVTFTDVTPASEPAAPTSGVVRISHGSGFRSVEQSASSSLDVSWK